MTAAARSTVVHPARFSVPVRHDTPDRGTWSDWSDEAVRVLFVPPHDGMALPDGARPCLPSEYPDIVVLTKPEAAQLLNSRLSPALGAILPVIDSCGAGGSDADRRRADAQITWTRPDATADALELLKGPIKRLRSLAPAVLQSTDPRVHLLARLFVRDRGIELRRTPNHRDTVSYIDSAAIPNVQSCAEELADLGLVKSVFFDKLPVCPRCHSARLSLREQCAACRSANVLEETILHHFRCAYQGRESEFKGTVGLTCPKCRERLEHFGVDYDRPGFLTGCHECGHASAETAVGFVCLDCESEGPATDLGSRVIYRYELADAGREYLINGLPLPSRGTQERDFGKCIRDFTKRHAASGEPCSVLVARWAASEDKLVSCTAQRALTLYASLLRETFTPETEIIEAPPLFFALLSRDAKEEVEQALPNIRNALHKNFASPPEVDYRVYGPEEILNVLLLGIAR